MSRLAMAAAAVFLVFTGASAFAAEEGAVDLRFEAGAVTGEVAGHPARDVLETLSRQAGFAYEADEAYLEVPLSGRLQSAPLLEALSELLRPFDYTMTFGEDGSVQRLRISKLSGDYVAPPPDALAPKPQAESAAVNAGPQMETVPGTDIQIAPGTTVTDEEIELFRELSEEETKVPEALNSLFYPEQAPGTEESGPPGPPANSAADLEISGFVPYESEFGPPEPDQPTGDLPDFIPEENETGPVKDPFAQ